MSYQGISKPRLLTLSIATIMGTCSGHVFAQETEEEKTEVIEVRGIRGSLIRAMDIKRDSDGVVDAISAEDIGKFPDTNLAESLQRVTGVSIERVNNEGSRITVRGWGPNFNLITLNGRQMPAANIEEQDASSDRSFDFANLASESVTGVEVYKTSNATISTGGIGATVNILTHKPLASPGLVASFGAKGISEDNRIGDSVTPEISGIFSQTFADDTIGISVVASRSVRDSFVRSAEVTSGWNSSVQSGQVLDNNGELVIDAGSSAILGAPQNFMYRFDDITRTRTNAQVTLQFAPTKDITATLDYTYAELENDVGRQELSAWFGGGLWSGTTFTEIDASNVISPMVYNSEDCCEYAFGVGDYGTVNDNRSIGFNLEWQVTDNLSLEFDAHDSSAEMGARDDQGTNNIVSPALFRRVGTQVDFSQNIPVMIGNLMPGENGMVDPSGIIASGNSFRNAFMRSEIQQFQLHGEYTFDDGFVRSLQFGASRVNFENRSAFSLNNGGDWNGLGSAGQLAGGDRTNAAGDENQVFNDAAFTVADLVDIPGPQNIGLNGSMVWVDYNMFTQDLANLYLNNPGLAGNVFSHCEAGRLCSATEFSTDRNLEEEQTAFYLQANMEFEVAQRPVKLNVGVRHESTDVTSNSLIPNYVSLVWRTPNELNLIQDGGVFANGSDDYNHTLPNLGLQVDLTDDLVARASVSKTLTRPTYDDLQAGAVPNSSQARTFDASAASSGDPSLLPNESTNFDLSLEYYYAEGSYLSLGYYKKDVENFVGDAIRQDVIYPNLVNPASGTRLQDAIASVVNQGNRNQEIRDFYVAQGYVDAQGNLIGDQSVYNPLSFTVTVPVNQDEASVDGFEVAVQHVFGDSGFGVIANYTTVDGDVNYDNSTVGEDQFALLGLSDSANLVGFYEKDGLTIRVAYNWRDEFLSDTSGGNNQFEPEYTEEYAQLDLSVNYEVTEQLIVSFEAINLNEEDSRRRARGSNMIIFASEQEARYTLGLRYNF